MKYNFDTEAVQFPKKKGVAINSKTTPIYQTSAFSFNDLEDMEGFYNGQSEYLYTRVGHPNTDELANGVAVLEGAQSGVCTASGLSAILAGVLSVCKSGDHIVATDDIYGGTYQLFAKELLDFGISVTFVSFTNAENIRTAIKENTKLIYSESITNPLLRVENIEEIVQLAKDHHIVSMIDNTFATPYLCRPYEKGVDLVVHSATKYIGGHSDVTAGVLVGREDLVAQARQKVVNLGMNLTPFEAWLAARGLKTLSVRMERQVKNAQKLANALQGHQGIAQVYYPTQVSEKGNGAVVSIDVTSKCDVATFFKSLSWVKIVPTLAGLETSVSYPFGTSHRALPDELREKLQITEGLIRISVGIEDADDIIMAFLNAIEQSIL